MLGNEGITTPAQRCGSMHCTAKEKKDEKNTKILQSVQNQQT